MSYDPLYVAYLVYFNRDRDYFECHEVLEELWLKCDREPLYKGLLQVAVGLYHYRNGNVRGGVMMLRSAYERLEPYPPDALGIDLGRLKQDVKAYVSALDDVERNPFNYYDLDIVIRDPELLRITQAAADEIAPNIPQRRSPQRGAKHEMRKAKRS